MTSTGRSSGPGNWTTLDGSAAIVRRLFRDRHVVRMRLAQPGGRDTNERRALHLLDRRRAAVAHRLPQPADQLMQHRCERALVRHTALDAFGDELLDVLDVALEVAVLREGAGAHGTHRPHPAILLVALALVDDHLARRFVGAGEQ